MDWNMKRFYQFFLSLSLSLGLSVVALAGSATVNKWVDKDGNVHYSQQPPSDVNYEKITVKTSPSSAGSTPDQSPKYSTGNGSGSSGDNAVVKQTTAKAEAQRQKNCEAAKKNLELYTVFRRVKDKNGNVVRLDDKDRAKRIEDSKAAIKEFCQ